LFYNVFEPKRLMGGLLCVFGEVLRDYWKSIGIPELSRETAKVYA
jgi:hypothetical protein